MFKLFSSLRSFLTNPVTYLCLAKNIAFSKLKGHNQVEDKNKIICIYSLYGTETSTSQFAFLCLFYVILL